MCACMCACMCVCANARTCPMRESDFTEMYSPVLPELHVVGKGVVLHQQLHRVQVTLAAGPVKTGHTLNTYRSHPEYRQAIP